MSEHKYKPEDIKPKHGKPSEYGFYICHFMGDGGGKWKRYPYHEHLTDIYWDNYIDYFIDIPDAPEELMPKKYPENKPSERGKYLCHISDDTVFNMEHDEWEVMKWEWDEYLLENNWNGYRELVDYFIDVNLDVNNDSAYLHSDNEIGIENEMNTRKYAQTNQKENKMEIIWETDELKATLYHDDALIYLKDAYGDMIGCSVDELTAFARHWLDLQGHDVIRRELEIAPCPNPECGGECKLEYIYHDGSAYLIKCTECGYSGPIAYTEEEAIRLHNLIAGDALPRKENK